MWSHISSRCVYPNKKAKFFFCANLMIAQFFLNILKQFMTAIVQLIFMNHFVLRLEGTERYDMIYRSLFRIFFRILKMTFFFMR